MPIASTDIGAKAVFRKTITVAEQAMFTGISGNLGSLYVDQVKAQSFGLEGVLAFELVVASLVTTCLSHLGGNRRVRALSLTFLDAVPIGATIEARAEITAIENGCIHCSVACYLDGTKLTVEGSAELVPVALRRAHRNV